MNSDPYSPVSSGQTQQNLSSIPVNGSRQKPMVRWNENDWKIFSFYLFSCVTCWTKNIYLFCAIRNKSSWKRRFFFLEIDGIFFVDELSLIVLNSTFSSSENIQLSMIHFLDDRKRRQKAARILNRYLCRNKWTSWVMYNCTESFENCRVIKLWWTNIRLRVYLRLFDITTTKCFKSLVGYQRNR